MSGGSFNYLCYRDASQLLSGESDGELQAMADKLAELEYAADASKETRELILVLRQTKDRVENYISRLRDIWHAVEWWESGDSSEDDVKENLAKYRGGDIEN